MGRILQNLKLPLLLFGICYFANVGLRLPHLFSLGYLNDDAGMILRSLEFIQEHGILAPFAAPLQPDGPLMLRPLQMISFYLEYQFFGTNPIPSHLIGIGWLSIGQAVALFTLLPIIGLLGSAVAIFPLSLSLAAAEPTLWLSDRHDLYLYTCFMLSLWGTLRALSKERSFLRSALLLSLIWWAGFFCNEKGTAVPLVSALLSYPLFHLRTPSDTFSRNRMVKIVLLGFVHLGLYLGYRFALFGTAIGGYDDTILLEQSIHLEIVTTWITTLLTTPFQQIHPSAYRIACGTSALAIGMILLPLRGNNSVRLILFSFVALLLSSIPTARSIHQPLHAVANGRLFWLPLIASSLFFGALLGESFYQSKRKWLPLIAAVLLLLPVTYAGRNALWRVRKATEYSNNVIAEYRSYCGCVDFAANDVRKLPLFHRKVNTFTEASWIKSTALYLGHPICEEPDPCIMKAVKGTPPLVPIQTSPSLLADSVGNSHEMIETDHSDK